MLSYVVCGHSGISYEHLYIVEGLCSFELTSFCANCSFLHFCTLLFIVCFHAFAHTYATTQGPLPTPVRKKRRITIHLLLLAKATLCPRNPMLLFSIPSTIAYATCSARWDGIMGCMATQHRFCVRRKRRTGRQGKAYQRIRSTAQVRMI